MKRKLTIQHDIFHNEKPGEMSFAIQWMIAFALLAIVSCGPPPPRNNVQSNSQNTLENKVTEYANSIAVLDAAYFIDEMMNLKRVATYNPGEKIISRTSRDPNNGPVDAGFYVDTYEEDGKTWRVLLEEDGPSVLTRMFFNDELTGTIRIFVDYQKDPIIEATFQELYELKHELFQLYLASPPPQSGGGFTSYFPVPYSKHITVMTDSLEDSLQYQFDILTFPPDSPIETFNGKIDSRLRQSLEKYKTFTEQNAIGRNEQTLINGFVSHTIKGGDTKLIINDSGPAAISFFAIQVDPLSIDNLENTRIKMYWDDIAEPAVNISLRDFFCANIGIPSNWNSISMGFFPKTDNFPNGFYYSQFYMPFQQKGQIVLENTSDQEITYKFARKLDYSDLPEDCLYFYSRSDQNRFAVGLIYSLFEFEGKGKLAGLQISSSIDSENSLEPMNFFYTGDPYFYVDGEENASIIGSGLDNYFNGGNRFEQYAPFWMPTHGNLYHAKEQPYKSHSYRFHLLDAIQFSTSLFYIQEIGCPIQFMGSGQVNSIPLDSRWTCYWYGKRAKTKVERKEKVHYYSIQDNPNPNNPVMIDLQVYLQMPPGQWLLRYAPVYDLSQVNQQEYYVE